MIRRYLSALVVLFGLGFAPVAMTAQEGAAAAGAADAGAAASTSSAPTGGTTAAATTTGEAGGSSAGSGAESSLTPGAGESSSDFLARVMEAKGGLTEEALAGAGTTPKEGEATLPTPKVGENEGNQQQEPGKPEEGKEGETTQDAEDDDDFDAYGESPAVLAPKALAEKITADAALKAAIDANPALKNELYANARLAAETAEFKKIFPTADAAQQAANGNKEYAALTDLVTSINKPEDAQGFYGKLFELSVLRDEEGQPLLDAKGNQQSDGTVGRLIHHTGALFLNHFENVAKSGNDDELTAAVEILKARAFGGPASTQEGLTEEQQQRAAALDARENGIKEKEAQAHQARVADFEQSIETGIDTYVDTEIGKLLARTDIPEKDRKDIDAKIRKAAYELVAANPEFAREQDELQRRAMGPKSRDARIGLGKKWLQTALPLVAPKIIAESGNKILAKQAKAQQTQAAREEASRSESTSSLRTARTTTPNEAADYVKLATENLAKRGMQNDTGALVAEIQRLKSGGQ